MASTTYNTDDYLHSPSSDNSSPMTVHSLPVTYDPQSNMYTYSSGLIPAPPLRTKRRQVKNACTKCQKACKKCDDARPCLRCVRYGFTDECVDSQRKERRKGIKRGPYKKRDEKAHIGNPIDRSVEYQGVPYTGAPYAQNGVPPVSTYMGPTAYGPVYYSQYYTPPSPPGKQRDLPPYYSQVYYSPPPQPPPPPEHNPPETEGNPYPAVQSPPQYYPASFMPPYAQLYAPYRPDGQIQPVAQAHYHGPVYRHSADHVDAMGVAHAHR